MTHQLELTPEMEARLKKAARRNGNDVDSYIRLVLERSLESNEQVTADETDPGYLLSLPKAERDHIIEAQAALAAPLYESDLTLPVKDRELTAFTALNGDPILENYCAD